MAKSIRSKWKRKMRSVRREKFGKKELERLKGILQKTEVKDVDMKDISNVKTAKEVKAESSEQMETNRASGKFDPVTMKNEHGNYPAWMNKRKIKKWKNEEKRKQKKKAKKKNLL